MEILVIAPSSTGRLADSFSTDWIAALIFAAAVATSPARAALSLTVVTDGGVADE